MSEALAIQIPTNEFATHAVMIPPPSAGSWPTIEVVHASSKPQRLRLSPGQTIPGTSWRITQWLGEGNMGVVYEARHVEIDRRAAIKVVFASLADDPAAVERFRAEARAAATVGSPNIVDVFDFAVLDDGRLMMAMEFVPGRSLQAIFMSEGRLSAPERLIGLFRQVCKGLQAAHEAGLVHRDIKPENIMVSDVAGRRDTVKLVDFGIVTILGERLSSYAGTPYYMPPEGMLGGAIDGRYDIYSVGCVMYEMLVGKPPYVDESINRVLAMHQTEPVPELVVDAEVPRKLVEVIVRCLAKDPADRFDSMIELEAALCEAQIEGKLRTTWDDLMLPAIDADRHAKLLARMPTRSSKRGVSAWWLPVLLAAGVIVGVIAWSTVRDSDFAAVASRSEVDAFVGRAHAAAAMAYYVYPPVDDPRADTAYKMLSELEGIDSEAAREAATQLRAELAEALVRVGDEIWAMDGGEPFALDFYVQAIMFDPLIEPARTRAAMSLGERMALSRKASEGDFTETELIAVAPLQALAGPSAAELHASLDDLAVRQPGPRRTSATAQPRGSSETNRLVAPVEKTSADSLVARALAARQAGRLVLAERLYHKALRLEPHRVDALSGLGRVYLEQANYAKSVNYYEMAVRRSGSNSELRIALGDAYVKTLDYARALAEYERAKRLGSSKAEKRIERTEQRIAG